MTVLAFPDPPLGTVELWLRPWCEADVPAIVIGGSDPLTAMFIPTVPVPYTEDDARSWLEGIEADRLDGEELCMAIVAADTDRVLGAIAAHLDSRARRASVGYWLLPDARRQGYMTSALRVWCEWLLDGLGIARIELTTDPENLPSQRVAERCGFQNEGLMRSHELVRSTGQRRDSLLWSLLPGELTAG